MTVAEHMEILPPEQTDEEREQIRQQALADSARNLSVDERYVLRRLASVVAQNPAAASTYAGTLITLSVAEFAASAGITFKVARRRLGVAADSVFGRSVSVQFDDQRTIFCWGEMLRTTDDFYELHFSGIFIMYLARIVGDINAGISLPLISFAEAVNAPAFVARGTKVPADLSIVLISRLKARTKRPKGMTWCQLTERVAKRLKRSMPRESVLDVLFAAENKYPLNRRRFQSPAFTHQDIDHLYDWIMEHKDQPDFLEW
jgi:hypothetical protein